MIPVIHGYDTTTLKMFIKKLHDKIGFQQFYGLGSLAPLFNPYDLRKAKLAINIILTVRKLLPEDAFLHIFGMGSPTLSLLAFYLGADSVDTHAWTHSAAYGKIYVPGEGQRFVLKNHKRFTHPQWSKAVNWETYYCHCPVCKKYGLEGLANSRNLRALHNLWVFQKHMENVRLRIKEGTFENFCIENLSKTQLEKMIEYARHKKLR